MEQSTSVYPPVGDIFCEISRVSVAPNLGTGTNQPVSRARMTQTGYKSTERETSTGMTD